MFSLIKKIMILAILAVVVGVPALIFGINAVDFAKYEDEISAYLSDKTGYKVTVFGPLKIKAWPKPEVFIASVEVDAFDGEEKLFTAHDIEVRFSYRDINRLGLAVEHARMSSPTVYLAKDVDGVENYLPKRAKRNFRSGGVPSLGPIRSIDEVTITNGSLRYVNEELGKIHTVENVNIMIGGTDLEHTVVDASATLDAIPVQISGTTKLQSFSAIPAELNVTVAESVLGLSGTFGEIFDNPRFYGDVSFDGPDAFSTLYTLLGVPEAQRMMNFPIAFNGNVDVAATRFSAKDLIAKIDKTQLTANGVYDMPKNKSGELTAAIEVSELDLNKLGLCGNPKAQSEADQGETPWSQELMDFALLRKSTVSIQTVIEKFRCDHRSFKNVELRVSGARGVLTLEDLVAEGIESGKVQVRGRFDASSPARGNFTVNLTDMPLDVLAGPQTGRYLTLPLSGRGEFRFQGKSQQEWMDGLSGKIAVTSQDGYVSGVSFTDVIGLVKSLVGEKHVQSRRKSPIQNMKMEMSINDGVVSVGENVIESGDVRATGSGKIDLAHWTINYRLVPTLKGKFGVIMPVRVRGSLSDPKVVPEVINTQNIGAAIGGVVGGPLGAAAGAALGQASSEDGSVEDAKLLPFDLKDTKNLQQNLKDFLGGE